MYFIYGASIKNAFNDFGILFADLSLKLAYKRLYTVAESKRLSNNSKLL